VKVLFLTDSLSDLDGVGRYAMRLIAALEELDPELEFEILLARKHRPTSSQVPDHWKISVALPPDYFFYMSPLRFAASLMLGVLRTWRRARGADLVHAIKDYPHSLVASLAARLAGIPCVATAHGTYTIVPLQDPRHARRARRTYARFASMIAVSGYTRRRLLETLGEDTLDPDRVAVVPIAVDVAHYLEARVIGERPWHGRRFTLAVGELKERKGHHLSLGAFCALAGRHPDLHHFVVGRPSEDDYQCSLDAMVERAGLVDRVHFLGNVSEDEKIDLFQRAKVFVHTPVTSADGGFEGFGIVYLEAAASGTPSVGSLDSGAEDALEDGVSGLLVAQEVSAIEGALDRLLSNEAEAAEMGQRAREAAGRCSWAANARAVRAIHERARA